MKKLLLIVGLILYSFSFSANAQFGGNRNMMRSSLSQNTQKPKDVKGAEKIKQLKTVYIAKELALKSEEYNDFWLVYNKYEEQLNNLWNDSRNQKGAFEDKSKVLQKEYQPLFLKVLGSEERVNKIFVAESNFREMLRKELKNRK